MTSDLLDGMRNSRLDARRALLAGHPVLGLLEARDLDHMLGFAVETYYPAGAQIFRMGDPGQSLMIIVEGQVKISVMASDGREAVLAVLEAGEILGEMAIIENKPRSADATTLSHCRLLVLHQRDFIPFLERSPRATIRLLALLSERLRRTSALLEATMLRHPAGTAGESASRPMRSRRLRLPTR